MTRAALLEAIAKRTGEKRRLQPIVDATLDEVLSVLRPRLESSWEGSDALQALYALRGGRP
jgi:hypothetical protein